MPRPPLLCAASRRLLRTALLWLLAFVVPLQCSAALLRMAAGPMHSHAGGAAAIGIGIAEPVLRDFRRDIGHAAAALPAPALTTLLHGHAHPQRHHHRAGDGMVTTTGDSALERIDASEDGSGAGGAFAALLPLLGAEPVWQVQRAAHAAPSSLPWVASSRVVAMPERPPRGRQDTGA